MLIKYLEEGDWNNKGYNKIIYLEYYLDFSDRIEERIVQIVGTADLSEVIEHLIEELAIVKRC